MKKIFYALMSTLAGTVLLMSYHTSTEVVSPHSPTNTPMAEPSMPSVTPPASSSSSNPPTSSDSSSSTPPSAPSSSSSSGLKDGTYPGSVENTQYGPVQVKIEVAGGQITQANAIQFPSGGGRDQEINSQAIPILDKETITAQSASISMVSGATYTSNGYLSSLQSAVDQARA